MSWCEYIVIFDVKLLMSMFWRQIDIKLMTNKIVWRQHVNTAYQGNINPL